MIKEFFQIQAGAILLCSPMWGTWLFIRWYDRRPTPQERWERNHRNVIAQRQKIDRWFKNTQ
jgi:hypothetical protein